MDLPRRRNVPRHRQLNALRPGRADIDAGHRIAWIRRRRIAAFQLKHRQRQVQIGLHIPFGANLVICELFRREILLRHRQRQKLVTGAWQKRLAVAAIYRDIFLRLENQAKARTDLFVLAGKRPVNRWQQVSAVNVEIVITHARHNVDMVAKADLILNIEGEEFDVGHGIT